MNLKKIIVHLLLIVTLVSGLTIFASSQAIEIEKVSFETQKILSFFDDSLAEESSKKINSSTRFSSSSEQNSDDKSSGPNQTLIYEMAKKDFKNLRTILDRRLFSVQSINWQIRDDEISKQALESSLSMNIDKNSTVTLEIEVFSQNEQREKLTIVQLSYTDISSGNKVHEFSRMYQQSKKKPD